eukprot:TRINITY_DN2748_c0_g1_i1.p2 TRINITY_DN2748_c0_g1~~TRINITY_DN2748_c0_g1_i1.p2  ORF type:complete len:590 (-),score=294.01 TRINITY_DN2748_c0_g1_i1:63-1724(-)
MRALLWSALCCALPAAIVCDTARGVDADLRRLERDVAAVAGTGAAVRSSTASTLTSTSTLTSSSTTSDDAVGAAAQAALSVGRLNPHGGGWGHSNSEGTAAGHASRAGWVPARGSSGGEGNGGGFLNEHDGAADFLKGLGNAGSDDFKKAKKELGLKYKAFEDEIKAYARELELPTEPCLSFRCYKENLEKLTTGGAWSTALASLNDGESAAGARMETSINAKLIDYRAGAREVVAKLPPQNEECNTADQAAACKRDFEDLNLIRNINGFESGNVNEMISTKMRNKPPSTIEIGTEPELEGGQHIDRMQSPEDQMKELESRSVGAMLVEEGEGEGVGATARAGTSTPTPRTGMSNTAFKDRIFRTIRDSATVLPEIFYIGAGANFNALNGAAESAVDFETYEAAVFVQGGAALGTDIVSIVGVNAMAGVAWKRSKSGESIEEYGGTGVSVEVGGDVEVTLSVVAEIDASAQFVPEWDGVLKVGGDVGIDFGVPTGVSFNLGISDASMIRSTRSCCSTRRCLAYKIWMMPGTSAMKVAAYSALAVFPPPSTARC